MKIQDLVDKELARIQGEREEKDPSGYISPSGLGRCYRFQYWQRKGEKPSNPIDQRTLRVFKCGNLFHDFVQSLIPDLETEKDCLLNDIRGRADIVDKDTVYDIKTQHSKSFFYMAKKGYDVTKERYSNWLQVACYARILKKPNISLVIISKDDFCINQYWDKESNWTDHVARELTMIRKYWVEGLPDAEPRCYGGRECQFCNYVDKCKEIGGKVWTSTKS